VNRVSFFARIGLIVILSLSLLWVGLLSLSIVSRNHAGGGARPPPAQVAGIAELLEATPVAGRDVAIAAVTSDTLDVAVLPGPWRASGDTIPPLDVGDRSVDAYQQALNGRPLIISSLRRTRLFPRAFGALPNALEFQIGLRTGDVLVIRSRSAVPMTVSGLPRGMGAGLFGTLVALIALWIMHRETRPLVKLAAAVDRMDLTSEPVLLPQSESLAPEIRALTAAFNRLQSRLAMLLKARMALLGGISHDVRTFATRLRLRADLVPEGPDRDRIESDITDMIRLLDDALLASRAGAGELSLELLDLDELTAAEVADRHAAGRSVTFAGPKSPASLIGDRLALRRVIANLIDNAVKFGRTAVVSVSIAGDQAILAVDDDGPGIPVDQRELLLEPFVRLEGSRSRESGGAGLGLAVVRSLAEAHGGSVAIADSPLGGARVEVSLPLFRDLGAGSA
jgi:signal transduction histidine kinase